MSALENGVYLDHGIIPGSVPFKGLGIDHLLRVEGLP